VNTREGTAYSSDLKGLGIGDSDTILVVWHDTLSFEDLVSRCQPCLVSVKLGLQLGSSAVEDNRVETKPVQERQGESEIIKLISQDGSSNSVHQLMIIRDCKGLT